MNEDNKRIAKNTLMLYFRMGISMVVSLFTARVVLNTLGVVDYGLFSVVGGVVAMFSFLNSAMSSGTQRFLTFELGRGNHEELKRVFSMSLTIHVMIAMIVFVLAETVGLWFLNTQMTIPPDRMEAANWVYQFSVLATMISLTQTPYSASIIAHERMSIYAYTGMAEVLLRLLIIYLLVYIDFDKLKVYAVLIFAVSFLMAMFYRWYCLKNFPETHFKVVKDKALFKSLTSFAGLNFCGAVIGLANGQGQNILLNMFFGPIVNAARGVAMSVNGVITLFVGNFMVAVNPQITKSYAANDFANFQSLIFRSAKFSYFLLAILSIPVLIQTQYILELWLKTPPEYSAIFAQFSIVNALITCISTPLMTAAQASGKLKKYVLGLAPIMLLNFPLLYIFLKLGYNPIAAYVINISIDFIVFFVRLRLLANMIPISVRKFLTTVFIRCWLVFIVAIVIQLYLIDFFEPTYLRLMLSSLLSVVTTGGLIYFLGLTESEKLFVLTLINKRIAKLNK